MQVHNYPLTDLTQPTLSKDPTKAVTSLNSLRMQHERCYWPISGDATKLILELIRPTHDLYLMNKKTTAGRSLNSEACNENRRVPERCDLSSQTRLL